MRVAGSAHEPVGVHHRDLAGDRGGVEPELGRERADGGGAAPVERAGEEVARPVEPVVDARPPAHALERPGERRELGLHRGDRAPVGPTRGLTGWLGSGHGHYLYHTDITRGGNPTDTSPTTTAITPPAPPVDPRRWITLAVVLTGIFIVGLDGSVLNVAIPTILRDFHTTLPQLQWVITGYSLTFAALLIIGGRLTDIHGPRKVFITGAAFFGVGSLIAALSTGVVMLVAGEAVIEGIGASLMAPASLAILTRTFHGRERGTAFAMWTAVMGASVAFGPVLGGFLTTEFSWRWAFLINVAIAPMAIVGVLLLTRPIPNTGVREPLDVPGAILIASGMALFVFGISEGTTYGWWHPLRDFGVAGVTVWPASIGVSVVPAAFLLSFVLLFSFYRLERSKERRNAWPLFEFGELRHRGFRNGLATLLFVAMGQTAFILIVSVVLQDAHHLSALDAGLWLVPVGITIVVSSQIGGWLTRRIDTVYVVRMGLTSQSLGLLAAVFVIGSDVTLPRLLPVFILFGTGIGFAASQLTNVILRDVQVEKAGAASGANSTVRMLGGALGIATVSAIIGAFTVHYAVENLRAANDLPPAARAAAIQHVHAQGIASTARSDAPPAVIATVEAAVSDAVGHASENATRFVTAVVVVGLGLSFLIPRTPTVVRTTTEDEDEDQIDEDEDQDDEDELDGEREAELLAEATTVQ